MATTAEKKPVLDLTILPVEVEVDDCTAVILEAARLNLPWEEYQVAVQVQCKDAVSNVFHITYKDSKELTQKLKTEVAKFKYVIFLFGKERLRQLGIVK
ncbi:MAG: hypothetical protein ACP5KA_07345 [Desulfurococcaceae archaeon]